jgi:Phosphotransferase enzyme family
VSEDSWRSSVHGLVVRSARVLAVRRDASWALPSLEFPAFADDDLSHTQRAFEGLLGAPVAVLRHAARDVDRERRTLDVVYVLDVLDHDWRPRPGIEWRDTGSLPQEHRELALRVLEEVEVPPRRAPWSGPGWLAGASSWIRDSLAALDRPTIGRVEQVRVWDLSCVLRARTAGGAVFFKATADFPLFVDEGRVMRGLSRLWRQIPRPLAVDSKRRWMLLDDLGPAVGWDAPLEERELVHRLFGLVQVASTEAVGALLAMGCIDRRHEWLARHADGLVADDTALAGLEDAEAERLRSLVPALVAMCIRLAAGPVPDALVHGDLHLSNVARRDGDYVFFDWTDACVTHPFLDLIDVFRETDPSVRNSLRDAYLSVWADFATQPELLRLWELAAPLAALNQAVSYRVIGASVEPGTTKQLEWALPYWLRLVLAADVEALAP